jgi:hypothetical protein
MLYPLELRAPMRDIFYGKNWRKELDDGQNVSGIKKGPPGKAAPWGCEAIV